MKWEDISRRGNGGKKGTNPEKEKEKEKEKSFLKSKTTNGTALRCCAASHSFSVGAEAAKRLSA